MANFAISIRFLGTAYAGWQVQKNAPSVQKTVQNAVAKTFGSMYDVSGCSRTDSGVHANEYVFHIKGVPYIDPSRIPVALNAHLPDDIGAFYAREVDDGFHARYSCKGKEYVYKIWNSHIRNPLVAETTWFYHHIIDCDSLDKAAKEFVGRHDFKSYMCTASDITDTVREVYYANVAREGDIVTFTVAADGFLYNMVRIMAGTLIAVDSGRIKSVAAVTKALDRKSAGMTLPAKGLWLNKVFYR